MGNYTCTMLLHESKVVQSFFLYKGTLFTTFVTQYKCKHFSIKLCCNDCKFHTYFGRFFFLSRNQWFQCQARISVGHTSHYITCNLIDVTAWGTEQMYGLDFISKQLYMAR